MAVRVYRVRGKRFIVNTRGRKPKVRTVPSYRIRQRHMWPVFLAFLIGVVLMLIALTMEFF